MNKIYRVVWNASTGAWVAVSETAKSKTKSRSKKAGVVTTGLASLVLGFAPQAFAETGTGGGTGTGTAISSCTGTTGATKQATASGGNAVAIGCNTTAGSDSGILDRQNPYNNSTTANTNNIKWSTDNGYTGGSTAIGTGAEAAGLATALGTYAKATNTAAVAIGVAAASTGNTSLAIGRQSTATADYAQAIGNVSAATGKGSLAVGHSATATGYRAIAIGSPDIENAGSSGSGQSGTNYQTTGQTKATAQDSIAFGGGAQATANNALSIGAFSQATAEKSVAIGTGATATAANAVVIGEGANTNVAGGVALGLNAQVTGINSAALGLNSVAAAQTGSAFLTNTAATTQGTVSFGNTTTKRRLTNLADGAAASDAVTVAQLQKQNDLSNQQGVDTAAALGGGSKYDASTGGITAPSYSVDGTTVGNVGAAISNVDARTTANSSNITTLQNQTFKIQANKDTATAVGANDTITFADGNNINITRTGNTISVATSATPTFTTVTSTGAASIGGALTVTGATTVGGTLTTTGVANLNGGASLNGNRLTNVGAATAGTDAVNLDQLNNALSGAGNADALGVSVATNLGGGAAYDKTTGAVSAPDYVLDTGNNDGSTTTYNNVGDALGNIDGRTTTNTADIADLTSGKAGLVQQASNTAEITVGAGTGGTSVNFANDKGSDRQLTGIASAGDYTLAGNANNAVNAGDLNSAIGDVTTTVTNTGFNITSNGSVASDNVKLGETVNFTNTDSNLVVSHTNNAVNYNLADNVTVDSLTANDGKGNVSTVTATGTNVTDGTNTANYAATGITLTNAAGKDTILESTGLTISGGPSITVDGIDADGKTISNLADGTQANDAVNLGQLNTATAAVDAKTDTLGASTAASLGGGATYNKTTGTIDKLGYVLDDGSNTATTTTYNNVGDALGNLDGRTTTNTADIADLTSGKAGLVQQASNTAQITVGAGTGGTSVNFANDKGEARQLTNVANGNVATGSTDAVTGDQLNSNAQSVASVIGGNAINKAGVITTTNIGGTGKNTIDGAIDSVRQSANAGWNVTANGTGSTSSNIGPNGTVTFNGDSNLTVTQNGTDDNGSVNVALNKDISINTITADDGKGNSTVLSTDGTYVTNAAGSAARYNADGITVTDAVGNSTVVNQTGLGFTDSKGNATGPSISAGGINAGGQRITNLADGTALDDAVTVGQALNAAQSLGDSVATNLGGGAVYNPATGTVTAPTYTLDDGSNTGTTADFNNVGDALTNIDGRTTTNTADIANLTDNLNNGTIGLVQQANNTAEITVGKDSLGTTVNFANANGDARQLTNVAAGSVAAGSTDAINGDQLNSSTQSVADVIGGNATNNGGVITTTNIGGTGENTIDGAIDNVRQAASANDAKTDALGTSTAANLGGGAAYDKTTGAVSAPDYVLDTGNNDGSTTTYNNVGDALTNLDGRTTTNTADIADLTSNLNNGTIGLVQQANNTASITVGKDSLGTTIDFANANGDARQLTNVANGNVAAGSTDAVTGDQLNSNAQSVTDLIGGNAFNNNGSVSASNIGGTGENTIDGAIENVRQSTQDLSAGAVQYERNLDGSVNYDRVTLNGNNGTVLGNVGSGEISASSTEAVNGSQIHAANTSIANALGGNATLNTDGTVSAPTYTLDDGSNTGTTADFNNVGDALGNLDGRTTANTADIADLASNLNNGTIGLVQQAGNTAEITVGKDSLGTSISFANANGEARQLRDVANGVDATDAANMQQLKDLTTALGGNVDPNTGVIIAPEYTVNNYSIDPNTGMMIVTPSVVNTVGDALNSIGGQINNLQTSDVGIKYFRTNSTQSDAVALGEDSIAIGPVSAAQQQGNRTISMGVDASSAADSAIAIGDGANIAQGADQSIAIGNNAQVNGEQSISIGTGNIVNGDRSGAIGDPSIINGSDSYSVGNNNTVNSDDTFVLGNNVTTTVDGSVALGSNSAATTGAGVAGYALQAASAADQLAIAATTSTTGAVAVGDAANGVYRQITGVAPGTEDSDAVNLAQLKAVDNALANLTSGIGNGSIGLVQQVGITAPITVGAATGGTIVNFAGTDGNRQLTGVAASGQNNAAATVGQIKDMASALGGGAAVNANGTLTAPTYNVQGGTQSNVGDALGALDTALNDVKNANQSLSNAAVQYDKNADGTVNKGQITLGGGADGTTLTNVKNGALTAGSKDAVNGGQLYETNQQVNNLASQINNGSVGLVQQAGNTAQVTVAANTGGTSVSMAGTSGNRTVTGVKAGAVTATSSDAINGAQLHASNTSVANALGGGAAVDASGNITAPSYQVAGETATNVGDALTKLDNQSNALSNRLDQAFYRTNERIDKVEKRANAGIAAALSMESAPFVPGKFTYSVGAGFHGGENAVGATLRRTSDSGRWSLTGGVAAASEGGASARIGISGIID